MDAYYAVLLTRANETKFDNSKQVVIEFNLEQRLPKSQVSLSLERASYAKGHDNKNVAINDSQSNLQRFIFRPDVFDLACNLRHRAGYFSLFVCVRAL